MDITYATSAAQPSQLPKFDMPEVCLIGRSNCGKSTLLNSLAGRRGLARTSRQPGRTQMVNFFSVSKNKGHLVDLPGYGYSALSSGQRTDWFGLLEAYFQRPELEKCLFLIDSRRDIVEEDWSLLAWLSRINNVHLVLTKVDKLNKRETARRLQEIPKEFERRQLPVPPISLVSAPKKTGTDKLRAEVMHIFSAATTKSPESQH